MTTKTIRTCEVIETLMACTEDELVPLAAVYAAERRPYIVDGLVVASSRTTPCLGYPYPIGCWAMDDMWSIHGRMVDHLIEVNIFSLELSEDDFTKVNFEGRGDDARRYSNWLAEGLMPPPIRALQTHGDQLRVIDGHRRVAAAKLAGRNTIRAWTSYLMETGKHDPWGKPIQASLTYEAARYGIAAADQMYADRCSINL